jgi:hypothetical protein
MADQYGVCSGEIFFRSYPDINKPNGLLEGVGNQLMEFLRSGQDPAEVNANHDTTLADLKEARKTSQECRQARIQALKDAEQSVRRSCHSQAARSRLLSARYDQALVGASRTLDRHLVSLVLRYHALLEEEFAVHSWRMREEQRICKRLKAQVRTSFHLGMFALHLEHETNGRVLLRRLPSNNPQFLRCKRAATENVRRGFFGDGARFSGINVLDVYVEPPGRDACAPAARVTLAPPEQSGTRPFPGQSQHPIPCACPSSECQPPLPPAGTTSRTS